MESTGYLNEQARLDAAEVLSRRLGVADIRAVVNDIAGSKKSQRSVEWIVAETTEQSARLRTRLPDEDLALFLVDLCGVQLLENRLLRERLALRASDDELERLHDDYPAVNRARGGRAARAKAVAKRRWEAGRSWPRHFVQVLDLPRVFAGVAGAPSEPNSLTVFPFVPLAELEDFQKELVTQLLDVLSAAPGSNRGVLTLPTGAGKTRTAVEAFVSWYLAQPRLSTILWIAQSEELCEQAVQAFREVWIDLGHRKSDVRHSLVVARLWGTHSLPSDLPDVVVASIQKLQAIVRDEDDTRRDELQAIREELGVVVVDEAHRVLAPSYTQVLTFLGVSLRRQSSRTPLLGLTATPFRANAEETRQLVGRFHGRLIEPRSLGSNPITELRQKGVLSEPVHELLDYGGPEFRMEERFVQHFDQFNDFHPTFLGRIGESKERNKAILDRLMAFPQDCPTLFFSCSVEQAQAMSVLLRRAGRRSETVTATTRGATRRALIEEFREGRLSVLCNYGVLTTGFDAPRVEALVVGRPTTSRVLYEQMIGRGMRGPRFGGTPTCTVVDVQDNIQFQGKLAYTEYSPYWSKQ